MEKASFSLAPPLGALLPPALICGPLSLSHAPKRALNEVYQSIGISSLPAMSLAHCTFQGIQLVPLTHDTIASEGGEVVYYLGSNSFDVSFQCFHFDCLSSKPLTVFTTTAAVFLPSPIPHVIYIEESVTRDLVTIRWIITICTR